MSVVIQSGLIGHMESTMTGMTAKCLGDSQWRVSWLPNRIFDRNQAVTSMMIAEHIGAHAMSDGPGCDGRCHHWPFIVTWAHELTLSGELAVIGVEAHLAVFGG